MARGVRKQPHPAGGRPSLPPARRTGWRGPADINGRDELTGVHDTKSGVLRLDEEARRVAAQIRFRPATRNGQAVDLTTNITITFQLA